MHDIPVLGRLIAGFIGWVLNATQIARSPDTPAGGQSVADTLTSLENVVTSPAVQSFHSGLQQVHSDGDVLYRAPYTAAAVLEFDNRADRTADLTGDTDGLTYDDTTAVLSGWQNWQYDMVVLTIADDFVFGAIDDPTPLVEWRDGNTAQTLIGRKGNGEYYIGDPSGESNDGEGNIIVPDGQRFTDDSTGTEIVFSIQAGDRIAIEPIPSGAGIRFNIWLMRAVTGDDSVVRDTMMALNSVTFASVGDFNLANIHFQHADEDGEDKTPFSQVALLASGQYESHGDFITATAGNLRDSTFGQRYTGKGSDVLTYAAPISLPMAVATYVHLGTGDGTGTGLDPNQVASTSTDLTPTDGLKTIVMTLRFDDKLGGFHLPHGVTYDKSTGGIVFTEGNWEICVSILVTNKTAGSQSGNRMWVKLLMKYDGNVRHQVTNYVRNSNHPGAGAPQSSIATEAALSLTGVVKADGTKITQIDLRAESTNDNIRANLAAAHLHAVRVT